MRQRMWQALGILTAVGVVLCWRAAPAAQAQNPDVLGALLIEVRGLRGAMEQMASAGPRIQLATARLQLAEQRINTLVRRLDDTRGSLATLDGDMTQKRDQIARGEEALKEENLPGRDDITRNVAFLKRNLIAAAADMQRLQADEAQISQDIATEQGRWNDINQRLDELDRALTKK